MFVVLAIATMTLSLVVKACRFVGAPELTVQILTLLEYAILIADSLVLLFSLARGAWKFLRETE